MEGTHDEDKKKDRVRVIVAYRQYWVVQVFYILRYCVIVQDIIVYKCI